MSEFHVVLLSPKTNGWAWGLERAMQLCNSGVKVVTIDFGPNLESNPRIAFQKKIFSESSIKNIHWQDLVEKKSIKRIKTLSKKLMNNLEDDINWVNFRYLDLPVGRILMSSFARNVGTRDFEIDLIPTRSRLYVLNQILLANLVFSNMNQNFKEISIANGRSPIEAVFLQKSRNLNLKTHVLERGASKKDWHIFPTSPHFAPDWWELLKKFEKSLQAEKYEIDAMEYWKKRFEGWDELSNRNWNIYRQKGTIPRNLDEKYVVFFCTSQHEVPAIEDFEYNSLEFKNQISAVKSLLRVCEEKGIQLVIKRHPNSIAQNGEDREKPIWNFLLNHPSILYVSPYEKIDNYLLMKKAHAILTFKSSTGIEASALRFATRSLGPANWAYEDECRAWNLGQIDEFLENPTVLDEKFHKTWAVMARNFGTRLRFFEEIHGGYALDNFGNKYYATEHYEKNFLQTSRRAIIKLWKFAEQKSKKS